MANKICTKCGATKPLADFAKDRSTRDGYHQQCLICKREAQSRWRATHPVEQREQFRIWSQQNYSEHLSRNRRWQENNRAKMRSSILKTRYNLTVDEYQRMFDEQAGRCTICGDAGPLVVDHKHDESRRVRSLLCVRCNSGLGFFRENIEVMRAAIAYLEADRVV